jgi:hypothetical protein
VHLFSSLLVKDVPIVNFFDTKIFRTPIRMPINVQKCDVVSPLSAFKEGFILRGLKKVARTNVEQLLSQGTYA